MQKKKASLNSKSVFRRAQGSTGQENGDVKPFGFSVETPTSQVKHKLFKKVEQVLFSSTGTDRDASCKHCIFKAFTPARFLNARSSHIPLALKNVTGKHAT